MWLNVWLQIKNDMSKKKNKDKRIRYASKPQKMMGCLSPYAGFATYILIKIYLLVFECDIFFLLLLLLLSIELFNIYIYWYRNKYFKSHWGIWVVSCLNDFSRYYTCLFNLLLLIPFLILSHIQTNHSCNVLTNK